VNGRKPLGKPFKFQNFAQALEFTNKIGGLHKNDSIRAAKTDELFSACHTLIPLDVNA
jgi:pterin-4a-carbinolamine dehydratase